MNEKNTADKVIRHKELKEDICKDVMNLENMEKLLMLKYFIVGVKSKE